jgi:hypothetical protein
MITSGMRGSALSEPRKKWWINGFVSSDFELGCVS